MDYMIDYNRYMSEFKTMMTKIGNKKISIGKDESKLEGLNRQITVFEKARVNTVTGVEQKKAELDKMLDLVKEYKSLEISKTELLRQMKTLIEKFDSIPWRSDLSPEEKIENSVYPDLEKKLDEVQHRLNEIPKIVNRVYYRRGDDAVVLEDFDEVAA